MPPASKARMTIVRSEPAGMVSVPEATPAATGTLKTTVVGRSGAEMSTTTVATDVPETSALMRRVASPPAGATASPEHAANSRREASATNGRSEEHTSELQSRLHLVCRLLLEKKKKKNICNKNTE